MPHSVPLIIIYRSLSVCVETIDDMLMIPQNMVQENSLHRIRANKDLDMIDLSEKLICCIMYTKTDTGLLEKKEGVE